MCNLPKFQESDCQFIKNEAVRIFKRLELIKLRKMKQAIN